MQSLIQADREGGFRLFYHGVTEEGTGGAVWHTLRPVPGEGGHMDSIAQARNFVARHKDNLIRDSPVVGAEGEGCRVIAVAAHVVEQLIDAVGVDAWNPEWIDRSVRQGTISVLLITHDHPSFHTREASGTASSGHVEASA